MSFQKIEEIFVLAAIVFGNAAAAGFLRKGLESVELTCNSDGAWNIIKDGNVLKIGTFVLLAFVFWKWLDSKRRMESVGWLLVMAGGAGNLWERIQYGCIMDYWKPVDWYPAFNAADAMIILGVLLVVATLRFSKSSRGRG